MQRVKLGVRVDNVQRVKLGVTVIKQTRIPVSHPIGGPVEHCRISPAAVCLKL